MKEAEEDALINGIEIQAKKVAADLTVKNIDPRSIMRDAIRLAIRAAVAHERERAAKVCEKNSEKAIALQSGPTDYLTNIMLRHHASQAYSCAAVIRRGE